jgi:hypothetical protein
VLITKDNLAGALGRRNGCVVVANGEKIKTAALGSQNAGSKASRTKF